VAKKPVDPAKAKQAKQKKLVIVLAVVFVLAMAYAVNTMMGMNGGGSPPQAASTTATTPAATPAATPTAPSTAAPTLAGSPTTTTAAPTDSSALVSVVTPPADPGQLESFSHFESKDPFSSQGPSAGASASSSGPSGSGKSGGGSSGGVKGSAPKTSSAAPAQTAAAAVFSVNGCEETVQAGSTFPASNPLFLLNSVTTTSAQVSIAGGSYATGQATLAVSVNKPVTLQNTADGTQYTIVLMPQGTTVPTNSAACGSSSTSTSTTPTTTTPTTTTTTTTTGP